MKRLIIILTAVLLATGSLYAGELNFAEFQYITAYEETIFGEKIKFFNGDTMYAWLHSNDQIAIMQSPVFYGPITSSARDFWHGPSYNPILFQEPIFEYPEADFPEELIGLRFYALQAGTFYYYADSQFRLLFRGSQGYTIYKWPIGIPFSDTVAVVVAQYPIPINDVVFIDGPLEILGTDPEIQVDWGITGRITVGCSGDIRIMDNIRYTDSELHTGAVYPSTNNCLGLASEANILIANTFENGRDNGGGLPYNPWRRSVIINGAVLACGESFSFEDQNDDSTVMGGQLPPWYYSNGTYPDERGYIHFWGTIAQYRKGYTHRSNHGGTGYLKDHHYYYGLRENPPPYFPYLPIEMSFSADSLDFGTVAYGDTASLELMLFNVSMDSINVLSCSYTDPAFSGSSIDDSLFCPNDSLEMTISFHPASSGDFNEWFILETDQGDYYIMLLGNCPEAGISEGDYEKQPNAFQFITAKPNPFNDRVALEFFAPENDVVKLTITDITGREVYYTASPCVPGLNRIHWQPEGQATGIYFYKIHNEKTFFTGKLLYLR